MLRRYERITFDKESITVPGKPVAEFVCPGHPLLDATIDVLLQRHRTLLRDGAILVAEADPRTEPRALVYLEHAIQDGRIDARGPAARRLEALRVRRGRPGRGGPAGGLRPLPGLSAHRAGRAGADPAAAG